MQACSESLCYLSAIWCSIEWTTWHNSWVVCWSAAGSLGQRTGEVRYWLLNNHLFYVVNILVISRSIDRERAASMRQTLLPGMHALHPMALRWLRLYLFA